MPIAVSCSECGAKYQIKDELAGKFIRCKCAKVLPVPASAAAPSAIPAVPLEPRPPVAPSAIPVTNPEAHKASPAPRAIPVAQPVPRQPANANAIQAAPAAQRPPAAVNAADDLPQPRRDHLRKAPLPANFVLVFGVGAAAIAAVLLVAVIVLASLLLRSPATPPPLAQVPLKIENPRNAAKVVNPVRSPERITEGFNRLVFGRTPIRFVALGKGVRGEDTSYRIVNIDTRKKIAEYQTKNDWVQFAVSPDGTMLAGRGGRQTSIDVHTPQGVHQIAVPWYDVFFDFTSANKLLVCYQRGDWQAHKFEIVEPAAGKAILSKDGPNEIRASPCALTPDRKHFARITHPALVTVRRMDTLEPVQEMPVTGKGISFGVQGLEFSPDGKLLAALLEDDGKARILCWNWQKGEVVHDHGMDRPLRAGPGNAVNCLPIEWLLDGSGWLVHGIFLIDKKSGKELTELAGFPGEWGRQRRLLDSRTLALAKDQGDVKSLDLVALDRAEIDEARRIIDQGGDPTASRLPRLAAGDLAAVRNVAAPAAAAWKGAVEAGPAKIAAPRLAVQAPPETIQQLVVAPTRAAVVSLAGHRVRLESFSLRGGRALEIVDLFQASARTGPFDHVTLPHTSRFLGDLNPDGKYFALREPADKKRVDVWTLPGGQHVIGLAPFKDVADPVILWSGLAGDLLLTASSNRLLAWKLPEGKAVYSVAGPFVPGSFTFSPARKHLAVLNGRSFLVLDVQSGECVGSLALPNEVAEARLATGAFRPDGKAFAALVPIFEIAPPGFALEQIISMSNQAILARWDLESGAAEPVLRLNQGPSRLQWVGPDHVLAGASIIDCTTGAAIAEVNAIPNQYRPAYSAHDLRHWFVLGGSLTCQTLPDAESLRLPRAIKDKTVEVAFGADMPIDLITEGTVPEAALEKLRVNLQRQKHPIVQGSRIQLAVHVEEGAATPIRVRQLPAPPPPPQFGNGFPKFGPGNFPKMAEPTVTEVPGLSITAQAILRDDKGELWKRTFKDSTQQGFGIVRSDDLTQFFHKPVRDRLEGWVRGLSLPGGIVRDNGQLIAYPRRIALRGD